MGRQANRAKQAHGQKPKTDGQIGAYIAKLAAAVLVGGLGFYFGAPLWKAALHWDHKDKWAMHKVVATDDLRSAAEKQRTEGATTTIPDLADSTAGQLYEFCLTYDAYTRHFGDDPKAAKKMLNAADAAIMYFGHEGELPSTDINIVRALLFFEQRRMTLTNNLESPIKEILPYFQALLKALMDYRENVGTEVTDDLLAMSVTEATKGELAV